MRKVINYSFRIILSVLFLIPYFLEPIAVYAASEQNMTIKQMREELAKFKAQQASAIKEKKQTQSEINQNKSNIVSANQEKDKIVGEVAEAEEKITDSNDRIERSKAEMETLLKYYQMSNNQNAYMEYIIGASTTTDLIMRVQAVNQITDYYNNKVVELDNLIKENEQLKVDLANKNVELDAAIKKSSEAIETLGDHLNEINDIQEDAESKIENMQTLINFYKKICPTETQPVSTCLDINSSNGWVKPTTKGRINSPFGARSSDVHYGIDIGGNTEGTPVYATANGVVAGVVDGKAVTRRNGKKSCGGNIVYIHVMVGGKRYTLTYGHLLSYNVKTGQQVNITTQIGTVGGGPQTWSWDRCSTGPHLHYQISQGYYMVDYQAFSLLNAKAIKPNGYPAKGVMWYNRSL